MARAIFGCDPDSVAAWKLSGGAQPEAALAKFQFGGTSVISTVSWLSLVRRGQVTIACENATLIFDDIAERRLALHRRQGELSYPAYSDERPLTREMAAFLQAVRSGRADAQHIRAGVSIVRAIAAAERSIALEGQPVAI
jgi:predicted dehydrogenase